MMDRKILYTLFCSISILAGYAQENRGGNASLSFNSGMHLAYPSVQFRNEPNFINTIPSWQIWCNKQLYNQQPIQVIVSVGVTRDLFNTRRKTENANGSVTVDRSRILIISGNIEGGVAYSFLSRTKFPLFSALSFRMSRALKENYSNVYLHEPGSDMGLNFKIGHKFDYGKTRLYLQLNYYQGLLKLARNNVLTSSGAQDSFIQSRSVGFQIGVVPVFKKRWSSVE